MLTTNQKGAIAEAEIAAAAVRIGAVVLRPIAEGRRYDLVLDLGPKLLRVQCKWAALEGDVVVVRTRTCRHTPSGYVRTTYCAQEVDGVAAYCGALDRCFWLPIADVADQTMVHLRLTPAANHQRRRLKWAEQYSFGAIAQLGERSAGSRKVEGSSPSSSTPAREPLL